MIPKIHLRADTLNPIEHAGQPAPGARNVKPIVGALTIGVWDWLIGGYEQRLSLTQQAKIHKVKTNPVDGKICDLNSGSGCTRSLSSSIGLIQMKSMFFLKIGRNETEFRLPDLYRQNYSE
jgi:hypothetical protein